MICQVISPSLDVTLSNRQTRFVVDRKLCEGFVHCRISRQSITLLWSDTDSPRILWSLRKQHFTSGGRTSTPSPYMICAGCPPPVAASQTLFPGDSVQTPRTPQKMLPHARWYGGALAFVLAVASLNISGCDNNSLSAGSTVEAPTSINLYPSMDGDRLYVFLTAVGGQPPTIPAPLIFDSGSAGLSLDAHAVFPANMFDGTGHLIFPAPESTLTYNGITVRPQAVEREFGGQGGITLDGYLAFASISFGDNAAQLTTSVMPLFLYDSTSSANGGTGFGNAQGIFGVDDLADQISLHPTATMLAPCTMENLSPCYVVSVLKYLTYNPLINAGFRLDPAVLQPCAISSANNCQPEPMLTVGLAPATETGFSVASLICPPTSSEEPPYYGPSFIEDYRVCEKSLPGGNVSVTLPSSSVPILFSGPVLFDTGTEQNLIQDPAASAPITEPLNTTVAVSFPISDNETFSYSYVVGVSDNTPTTLQSVVNNGQNHIGVDYFEYNHFFIDYNFGLEGWKPGAP